MKHLLLTLFLGLSITGLSQTEYKDLYEKLIYEKNALKINSYSNQVYKACNYILNNDYYNANKGKYKYAQQLILTWAHRSNSLLNPNIGNIYTIAKEDTLLSNIYKISLIKYILEEHINNNGDYSFNAFQNSNKELDNQITIKACSIFLEYILKYHYLKIDIQLYRAINYKNNGKLEYFIFTTNSEEVLNPNYNLLVKEIENYKSQNQYDSIDNIILHTTNYLLSKPYNYKNKEYDDAILSVNKWLAKTNKYKVPFTGNIFILCQDSKRLIDLYTASMINYMIRERHLDITIQKKKIDLKPIIKNDSLTFNEIQKNQILVGGGKKFLQYISYKSDIDLNEYFKIAIQYKKNGLLENYISKNSLPIIFLSKEEIKKLQKEKLDKEIKNNLGEIIIDKDIPFSIIETPPSIKNSKCNEKPKICLNKGIQKVVVKKFDIRSANTLNLSPGKKRIYLQFKITTTGDTKIISIRSPHIELSNEAYKLAQNFPKFNPGLQRGEPVNVNYMLPITFNVD